MCIRDRAIRAAGVKDSQVVVHGLRRSVSTQMEAAGVALFLRQQVLGHTAGNITDGSYTDPASVKRRAEAVENVTYGQAVVDLLALRAESLDGALLGVEEPREDLRKR